MSEKVFKYDMMVEEALRSVVSKALQHAAIHGLPNGHHFYITFKTGRRDVDIPVFLKEQYPDEMTIVLEHQFWDLKIHEREFEVALSFNDKRERLLIPLNAITAFSDPSVKFGLQFQEIENNEDQIINDINLDTSDSKKQELVGKSSGEVVSLEKFRNKSTNSTN
ncbi:ClpXP protease specificity-enhancing factor SspB [Rhodospirillaceae bacterium]|nr:ClpXP protease specificity-enhancing factor SspB [Rhodospirillaceae bacterium]